MQRTNGHSTAEALDFGDSEYVAFSWDTEPTLALSNAEAVVYVLGAVALLVLAAMIWTHYAERGK